MKPAALLALAGILLAGCKSGYTLTGEIPDLEQSTVYLCTAEDYPADLKIGRASCRERVCLYV